VLKPISELRSIACHMGLHGAIRHRRTPPDKTGRCSIYLPRRDERLR